MEINPSSLKNKNNRLGRGLDALLGSSDEDQLLFLDIEKISPNKSQPRKNFEKESLEELCQSIKSHGVLQPILIEKQGEDYQIIAGERRWRAAGLAGLQKIPVIIKQNSEKAFLALIENIQREDLSPIEESRAFKKIIDQKKISQQELAEKLGRSRSSVANSLRLLSLDEEVQKLVDEKKISFAQARELLRFSSPREQREMARACLKKKFTVRKISRKADKDSDSPFWLKQILFNLEKKFSQRLKLSYKKGKGRLVFSFQNEKELKNILDKLMES